MGAQSSDHRTPAEGERTRTLSRRRFIRTAAIVSGSLSLALLTACTQQTQQPTPAVQPTKPPAAQVQPTAAPVAQPTKPAVAPTAPAAATAAPQPTAAPQATTKTGGTLTVAISADIATVDPHTSGLLVWNIIRQNVFDQLTYFDARDFQTKPKLAKEWKWEDNDTSLVVTIHDNVKFHNGEKLTAEDVKFTYDRVRDSKTGSPWGSMINAIQSIEVVNPTTVKFKTQAFSGKLVGALSWIDVASAKAFDPQSKTPIGSGPFKFVEWRVNDQIRVEKNKDYWQKEKPLVDTLIYKPITQIETRLAALESGQIDILFDLALKDVERVKRNQNLDVAVTEPSDWLFTAYLNMRKPPFDNQKVRQAFALAIDRDNFIKAFLAGQGTPAFSPFVESHWAHNPKLKGKFNHDVAAAAKLLADAGHARGQGIKFSLMIPSGYPEYKALSEMMQATWSELGAQVSIDEVELATWANRLLQTREFDAAVDGTRRCAGDPAITFSGGYIFPPGPNNICGFMPEMLPEYVDLVGKAEATKDQKLRTEMYQKAQDLFVEFAPGPMIAHKSIAHGLRKHVKGFVPHPQYHQDFSTSWLDK